jgi:hypothetical protein
MIGIIRDRIQDGIKRGQTLAQSGREADARLRSAIRPRHRRVDDGHVHRGGVQKLGWEVGADRRSAAENNA